jgi:hypothetical protein
MMAVFPLCAMPSEQFLRHILFFTEYGYTLLGHKPMTEEFFPYVTEHLFVLQYYIPPANEVEKFCKFINTCQGYRAFFKKNQHDCLLIVINDNEIERVVKENFDKFLAYLGQDCLCELLRSNPYDICRNNHELLGILFGYGAKNSYIWQHSCIIYRECRSMDQLSRFQPVIEVPRFIGLDLDETKNIASSYESDSKEIIKALSAENTYDYLKAKMQKTNIPKKIGGEYVPEHQK